MGIASYGFAAGLVAFTVVACSSDGETLVVAITPATMQTLGETICAKAAECTSDAFIQVAYGSADTCKTRFVAQLQLDAKASGYGVSDSGGVACNNVLKNTPCADVLDGNLPAECQFKGSLADGSSCSADAQCATGSCFIAETASCGKCGPRAALGADCTNAQCAPGLKCNGSNICTNGQTGAACSKDSDCRDLTYCRSSVCTLPLTEGTVCKSNPTSADIPCDVTKGLFCLGDKLTDPTGTCKKVAITVAATGATCGLTLAPLSVAVCANGDCKGNKCVAHAADGTTCTEADDNCAAPAKCRNGICSLKDSSVCK